MTPSKIKQHLEDEEAERISKLPLDEFSKEEIKMLKGDDFEIDKDNKEAKSTEKNYTFVIKKSLSLNDEVLFALNITNKDGEVIYDRKFKVNKRSQHKDTIDFMLDKCAYVLHDIKDKAMKSIDPYGEEKWDEDEKEKILNRNNFVDPKTGLAMGMPVIPMEKISDEDSEEDPDIDDDDKIEDDLDECPACGGSGKSSVGKGKSSGVCDLCKGEGIVEFEKSEAYLRRKKDDQEILPPDHEHDHWWREEKKDEEDWKDKWFIKNPYDVANYWKNKKGTSKQQVKSFLDGSEPAVKKEILKLFDVQELENVPMDALLKMEDDIYRDLHKKVMQNNKKEIEDIVNECDPKVKDKLLAQYYMDELFTMEPDELEDIIGSIEDDIIEENEEKKEKKVMTGDVYKNYQSWSDKGYPYPPPPKKVILDKPIIGSDAPKKAEQLTGSAKWMKFLAEEDAKLGKNLVKYINPGSKYNGEIGTYQGGRIKNGRNQQSVRFELDGGLRNVVVYFDEGEATLEPVEGKPKAVKQKFKDNYELGNYYDEIAKGVKIGKESNTAKRVKEIDKIVEEDNKAKAEAKPEAKPKGKKAAKKEPDKVKELEDKLYADDPKLKLYDEFIKKHGVPEEKEEEEIAKAVKDKVKKKEEPKPKKNQFKEVECWNCSGWGRQQDGSPCARCGGDGRIMVDKDWRGPNYSIGGASDYSYGS